MKQFKNASHGFTIVELLVVIVVIGILAAITIVSYSGITSRANTSKAQSNAQSVQSVAEIINADTGSFPATIAAFTTGSTTTKLPSSVTVIAGLGGSAGAFTGGSTAETTLWSGVASANRANTVTWECLTTCTNPTGGRITYYDFTTNARAATIIYVGAANATSDYVAAPAS